MAHFLNPNPTSFGAQSVLNVLESGNIYFNGGKVGIGISPSDTQQLQVNGSIKCSNATETDEAVTLSQLNSNLMDYLPLAGGTLTGDVSMGSNNLNSVATLNATTVSTGSVASGAYSGDATFNEIYPNDDIVFTKTDGATSKLISWDSAALHVATQRDFSIVHDASQNLVIRGAADATLLTINDSTLSASKPISMNGNNIQGVDGLIFAAGGGIQSMSEPFTIKNNSAQTMLSIDETTFEISASGNIVMASNLITGLGNAVSDSDALNRQTADARYVNITGDVMTGSLSLGVEHLTTTGIDGAVGYDLVFTTTGGDMYLDSSTKINIDAASATTDAIVLNSSNNIINGIKLQCNSIDVLAMTATSITASQALSMGGNKITGLAAGTSNGDCVRYEQLVGAYLPLSGGSLTGPITNTANNLDLTTTGANNINITSTQGLFLTSTDNLPNAINIHASNPVGEVTIEANSNNALIVKSAEVDCNVDLVMGSNDITGVNEISNTSRLTLSSSQVSTEAIVLNSSDASGGIKLQANSADIIAITTSAITMSENVNITEVNSGGTTELQVYNSSNTASSNTLIDIRVGGSVAGDPYIAFDIDGVGGYAIGIDNSDSDKFKITRGGPPTMASTSALEITTTGILTIPNNGSGFQTSSSSDFYSQTRNEGTGGCYHLIYSGTGSGDPYLKISTSTTEYSIGIDNNDSDKLKITNSTSPSGGATAITIDTSENTTLGGSLTMGNNSILGVNDLELNTDTFIKFFDGLGTNTSGVYWSDTNHGIFCHRSSNIMYHKEYGTHDFQTFGTNSRMKISSSGVIIGAPTGSFKGAGTLNAQNGVFDNGTKLTCYPLEKYLTGTVDVKAYNEKFPDITYEEGYWYPEDEEEHKPEKQKFRTVTIKREHEGIPKFLAKCDSEYNPLNVDCYWKHIEDKKHLPAMPNPDKWNDDNQASTGGYIQRLIETVECQAVHIHQLNERLKVLENK